MALKGTTDHAQDSRCHDAFLGILDTEVDKIVLCSASPTTFAEANSTYTLAYKTAYAVGSPADRGAGGREVTCPAVSGGVISGAGIATHRAMVDTVNSRLLEVRKLDSNVSLTNPGTNTWSCASFKIGVPAST